MSTKVDLNRVTDFKTTRDAFSTLWGFFVKHTRYAVANIKSLNERTSTLEAKGNSNATIVNIVRRNIKGIYDRINVFEGWSTDTEERIAEINERLELVNQQLRNMELHNDELRNKVGYLTQTIRALAANDKREVYSLMSTEQLQTGGIDFKKNYTNLEQPPYDGIEDQQKGMVIETDMDLDI